MRRVEEESEREREKERVETERERDRMHPFSLVYHIPVIELFIIFSEWFFLQYPYQIF